jgi:hypothetical protein
MEASKKVCTTYPSKSASAPVVHINPPVENFFSLMHKNLLSGKCTARECSKIIQLATDKHVGGTICTVQECIKFASGKTGKCISHGGGIRCPNCVDWVDSGSGSPKYDGHCAACFKRNFPEDPRSKVIRAHTKEIMVRNIINATFDGFIHDRPLYTG